ncbi:MAG TPA: hypothetical protein VH089_27980 [Streptosporangiaceae bacterium]|nr:hypothetical protein [Streptosporangiaceae bacterium]
MERLIRRIGALVIAAAIVFLIIYDVASGRGFSDWWAEHAITTSLVSDLLIVGATALIFDEVHAYRQRKARSVSVAAQSLIVYGQAREAYQAVTAVVSDPSVDDTVPDELRDLASNLLVASPSLFDDRDARDFLLQLDRLMASLYSAANGQSDRPDGIGRLDELANRMNQVQASFDPLVARFPTDYQQRVRDADRDIDSGTASGAADGAPGPT